MKLEVLADADAVARRAAAHIAAASRAALAARGRFVLAVSGGRTPWPMLRALADQDVPWSAVHVFQVDERVAPAGDPDRNLTHLRESLLDARRPEQIHAMPVEAPISTPPPRTTRASSRASPARRRCSTSCISASAPTATPRRSCPATRCSSVADRDVALTGPYQERRRMTLTYPVLDRAREILWLVTGADKAPMLARLRAGDRSIPAGRVRGERALALVDRAAAAALERH